MDVAGLAAVLSGSVQRVVRQNSHAYEKLVAIRWPIQNRRCQKSCGPAMKKSLKDRLIAVRANAAVFSGGMAFGKTESYSLLEWELAGLWLPIGSSILASADMPEAGPCPQLLHRQGRAHRHRRLRGLVHRARLVEAVEQRSQPGTRGGQAWHNICRRFFDVDGSAKASNERLLSGQFDGFHRQDIQLNNSIILWSH